MGRLAQKGLDYFPLDTTWETAVKLVKAKFGALKGAGFLSEIWASIYRENYYRSWNEEDELLFADEIKEPIEWVREVIAYCLEKKIFDKALYDSKRILTSNGIQKRYFKIARDSLHRDYIDYIEGITYPRYMPDKVQLYPDKVQLYPTEGADSENKVVLYADKLKQAKAKQYNKELASCALVDNFSEDEEQELFEIALSKAKLNPKNRYPQAVARKMTRDEDVLAEFNRRHPPELEPELPDPGPCPDCGGDRLHYPGDPRDRVRCMRCGKAAVFDFDSWVEEKALETVDTS